MARLVETFQNRSRALIAGALSPGRRTKAFPQFRYGYEEGLGLYAISERPLLVMPFDPSPGLRGVRLSREVPRSCGASAAQDPRQRPG